MSQVTYRACPRCYQYLFVRRNLFHDKPVSFLCPACERGVIEIDPRCVSWTRKLADKKWDGWAVEINNNDAFCDRRELMLLLERGSPSRLSTTNRHSCQIGTQAVTSYRTHAMLDRGAARRVLTMSAMLSMLESWPIRWLCKIRWFARRRRQLSDRLYSRLLEAGR